MDAVSLTPQLNSTRIGFGCAGLMRESSRKTRQQVLGAAFEEGIRHFDVARMYGLGMAEGELGRFAKGRRDQLVLVTKFGIEPSSAPAGLARLQGPARRLMARYPALRGYVKQRSATLHKSGRYDVRSARESLHKSLRELQTDYVDVLLIHDPPSPTAVESVELWAYLDEARQTGDIGAWGVAGECGGWSEMERALPASAILQMRDDILSRRSTDGAGREHSRPRITFGVLSNALERIVGHLHDSSERRARWHQLVGADCARAEVLAPLLLCDALASNPNGVVLFSTTRPWRLAGLADTVSRARRQDPALLALRRLIGEERAFLAPGESHTSVGASVPGLSSELAVAVESNGSGG
jgi:D-threo-aldose 1-dehydrogenase